MNMGRLFLLALLAGPLGCSSNNNGNGGGGNADMALPPGTTQMQLISADYMLAAGTEDYWCQRMTVTSDIYIVQVTPVSPLGVHHEVLAIDPSGAYPDGLIKQSANPQGCPAIGTNWTPLFASGVGSPSLDMPPGIALKVSAGQQVVLNMHLFDAGTSPVSGTAVLNVAAAVDPTGYQLAGVPFVGNINFQVPAAGGTVNGKCTLSSDTQYFALFPHMHLQGQHMKVVTSGSVNMTVWDQDYSFMEQKFGTWAPIQLKKGDVITNTCTYGPSPNGTVTKFGESTTNEMCFAISYVSPPITTSFGSPFCIN
jgi:hypothetical protein